MSYKRGGHLIVNSSLFSLATYLTFYAIYPIAWTIHFIYYRITVKDRWRAMDYLRKRGNKAIMVSNHTAPMDPVLMSMAIMPHCAYQTLLEETMCTPVLNTFIQLLGGMPVPPGRFGRERFVEEVRKALKRRRLIHFYPEGECYIQNQEVYRFHQGAFMASMDLNIPIIPCANVYTEPKKFLGMQRAIPKSTLYILDPIYPDQFKTAKEYATYTHDLIQKTIYEHGGTNKYSKGHMERMEGING